MNHVKRVVVFDLDGTLVDAYQAITSSFNQVMRAFGLAMQPAAVIRRAVGLGDRALLLPFVGADTIEKALALYRRLHCRDLEKGVRILPGAKRLLQQLEKNGSVLAIASNRPRRFCRIILRVTGLRLFFDYMLCGDDVRHRKPHPQMLRAIMRRYHVLPEQVLYVGDMIIDIETGKRAGVRTVAVASGSCRAAELRRAMPYRLVKSLVGVKL